MPSPTTLVLGAGASHGHGFPVGSQLRSQLLALGDNGNTDLPSFLGYGMGTIRGFVRTFRESQLLSIDAFLGRRLD